MNRRCINIICYIALAAALGAVFLLMNPEAAGIEEYIPPAKYAGALFDGSYVHHIDLIIDEEEWRTLLENAGDEEYVPCDVDIDGKVVKNAGIRAKGNNSLTLIEHYGSARFSLKIEFDHYETGNTYYGLDKLALNSSFQDNSYMKDYLAYKMMDFMNVPAPLCSYAFVTVNGEDWGLYVAVEEIEDAFLRRVYGKNPGELYKPDYRRTDEPNYDVALIYTDDDHASYDNIFRNARTPADEGDKDRLVASLKKLGGGDMSAVDVDQAIRYFVAQTFVVNLDSYLGRTGHNYFLYEKDGELSMLPWDYNLAYGTYALGTSYPRTDAAHFVNFPIDTPNTGEIMLNRPMFHQLMLAGDNFETYRQYYSRFISSYFESGYFDLIVERTAAMIAPYVERDPTAFCSYEDHKLGVYTIAEFCRLRAQSVRAQLDGRLPSTIAGQERYTGGYVDASHIRIEDMGELDDMTD